MFRDDRIARVTDDSIFGEQDRTRLLVKRSDGSAMGKTDLEEVRKLALKWWRQICTERSMK